MGLLLGTGCGMGTLLSTDAGLGTLLGTGGGTGFLLVRCSGTVPRLDTTGSGPNTLRDTTAPS